MRIHVALFVSCVLALGFTSAKAEAKPRTRSEGADPLANLRREGYVEIRLRRNNVEHFEVSARINGKNVTLTVDTGASHTTLDRDSARTLGLRSGAKAKAAGLGKGQSASLTTVDRLEIGGLVLQKWSVAIVDFSAMNEALKQAGAGRQDGVIGADILVGRSGIIDCAKGRLFLKR